MNLFICATPLHCLIIKEIIRVNKLNKMECVIFCFSYKNKNSEVICKYLETLRAECKNVIFFEVKSYLLLSLKELRSFFFKKSYRAVYVANIDMPLIHFILSYTQFQSLYTYDDGVGNIVKESVFYCEDKSIKSAFRNILYSHLGNSFNMKRVKSESICHYSIYENRDNIGSEISWIKPRNVFGMREKIFYPNVKNSAIIILGTVYNEVLSDKGKIKILYDRIQYFIDKNSDKEVYYLPHPRCREHSLANISALEYCDVAEVILYKMLDKYSHIDVFGFVSSAQFNIEFPGVINNYYFTSMLLKTEMNAYIKIAQMFNFTPYNIDAD